MNSFLSFFSLSSPKGFLKINFWNYFLHLSAFIIFFTVFGKIHAQSGTVVHKITTGATTLSIRELGHNKYGIGIKLGSTYYVQEKPCAIEVVTQGGQTSWATGSYTSVQDLGNDTYKCTAVQTSENGSKFTFTDIYSLQNFDCFKVDRKVKVSSAQSADVGFSTRLTFSQNETSIMNDYDFFAPGIWYKDNKKVSDVSLASNLNDYYYWFREDRMPLPIFMLRNKSTGATFSVAHLNPDGSTFVGEDGLNRIIDGRMKFASMGMQNNTQPSVGILYPGSEGEHTGVYGMSSTKKWAYRSHPVTNGYSQNYTLGMRLYHERDYPSALKNTWNAFYNIFNPKIYNCNLSQIYSDEINLLDNYWQSINGSSGFPFRVKLDGTVQKQNDYNFNMGFVGMQIPNAAILLREGINADNADMRSKAEQTIDWWANNAITSTGCPRTWYDPYPKFWRDYPTFARVVGDGMKGMLWAWNFEKKRGVDKVNWLNACYSVANWLVSEQNNDGSFPRAWDYISGNVLYNEKSNTSHVIPFLVDMYKVTKNNLFRDAAINAGNYIFTNSYENFNYVGGTPDNPNVPDKEAASMALRAFLALYDTNKDPKWLDAVKQTVYYYDTWVYSWNVPIPANDPNATYPNDRSTTGLSLIATGQNAADSYAAIDAFNFYRMYLYTGDEHLLKMSKLLLRNTKQGVNWNRNDPIPGFGEYGIISEALTVTIPRGHSVDFYLPWQTYNMIEPMVLLWDTFQAETYNIDEINNLSNKNSLNDNYSDTRNYTSSTSENVVSGEVYIIVNRNSGKVLEVADDNIEDGANIQQGSFQDSLNQYWKVMDVGNAKWKFKGLNSNKVIGISNGSIVNGGNLIQKSNQNTDDQIWDIVGVGGGYWKIVNKNSGKIMDVENFSKEDGANISQYTDNDTSNQEWLFVKKKNTELKNSKIKHSGTKQIDLFPNPVNSTLFIKPIDEKVQLHALYNLNGQTIYNLENIKNHQIDVAPLPGGVYFIRYSVKGKMKDVLFIKK